jgi:hypothetical protein
LINPKEETVATLDKVTEGVSHILADEIVHSKEAVDQIKYGGPFINDVIQMCPFSEPIPYSYSTPGVYIRLKSQPLIV